MRHSLSLTSVCTEAGSAPELPAGHVPLEAIARVAIAYGRFQGMAFQFQFCHTPFSVCTPSAPCSKPDIAACRYWNPSEFSPSAPTPCMPPAARCIGGQYHECSAEYDGDYCASCRDGFYTRDGACVLCVASETQKVYIIIASFVVFLNMLFFSAPADLTRTVVLILSMLKLFR